MGEKKQGRQRLDVLLVERGLAETRSKAAARILAGEVVVDDHRVDKPGALVREDAVVRLKGEGEPFVSRGGRKLEAALSAWPVPVEDAICVDVGASTGGFTDVLLRRGAAKVYAIDVGYGQLAHRLRTDPRVVNLERTHVKKLPPGSLAPAPRIAVVDVSFISLATVLPSIAALLDPGDAWIVALIKPQFEAGREHVGKGGIVRDEAARAASVERVIEAARALSFDLVGRQESPITGADGNVEHLAAFRRRRVDTGGPAR